jgi:hypothetical protein
MHPYSQLPDRNFWKKFVSDSPWRDLQLSDEPKFKVNTSDRVATAGSCFAQHISRYMKRVGLAPYIAESAHSLMVEHGGNVESYGLFSARYGNIYTARQCVELFRQAFGLIPMVEDFVEHESRWYDLVRPNVQKEGFASLHEARADRAYHLERVKVMFETADVFVFTLGLTESWYNARSGHTYPACPGTVRGTFDPDEHRFRNFTCSEVVTDLETLIGELKRVNPALKVILTVSPVPLVATRSDRNVLVASSYSKSALRAAVGEVELRHDHVTYFPSYEIVSHPASFGQYLAADLREVTERGVAHVMDCFLSSFYGLGAPARASAGAPWAAPSVAAPAVDAPLPECDELFNFRP